MSQCRLPRRSRSFAKSSMARNPLIEAIHAARYDLETCARHERAACQSKLDELLRQALELANHRRPRSNCWTLCSTIIANSSEAKGERNGLDCPPVVENDSHLESLAV